MSTEKRKFIQSTAALFVASHHMKPDTDKAIDWADTLWKKLCERGYGPTSKTGEKERVGTDYYKKLEQNQQKFFCLFWTNFKHPHGKQRAAKAWGELGVLPDSEYHVICEAAKLEALKQLPTGQVRKMAEGWIRERRWEDAAPVEKTLKPQSSAKDIEIRETMQSLTHANNQFKQTGLDDWKKEAARLQAKLNKLKGEG